MIIMVMTITMKSLMLLIYFKAILMKLTYCWKIREESWNIDSDDIAPSYNDEDEDIDEVIRDIEQNDQIISDKSTMSE